MTTPDVVCVTHGEDADGLTCAALLKRVKKTRHILVTYDELKDVLEKLTEPIHELYVCDLNIREALVEHFLRIASFAKVTFIDHHPCSKSLLKKLEDAGVVVVHDTRDCASVLLYNYYKDKLGRASGRLAAFAAWADQFEDGPIAENLLREYDRQSVQHEGLLLAHALTGLQSKNFKEEVVNKLSQLTFPHRIPRVPESALKHLESLSQIIETLQKESINLGRLAYFQGAENTPIGAVAGMITDAVGVEVGLCFKIIEDLVNVSIRSRRGISYHLGEITKIVAVNHGGFGGGHKRASGASIPKKKIQFFIKDIIKEIDRQA